MYAPQSAYNTPLKEILEAIFFGSRLDLSLLAFIQIIPTLTTIFLQFIKSDYLLSKLKTIFIYYFCIFYTIISIIIFMDFAYFSFFGEHITIIFYGLFDDDTISLLKIAYKNYPIVLISIAIFIYFYLLFKLIKYIFNSNCKIYFKSNSLLKKSLSTLVLIAINFIAIRGSFGIFPIYHWPKDISRDNFVNNISKSPFFSFYNATKEYIKSKKQEFNYAKMMGFENNLDKALEIVTQKPNAKIDKLYYYLKETTPKNDKLKKDPPNVIVLMVESFGLPILKYQSNNFDIMRSLKKHFDSGILFTNIISSYNGTIGSMESMLLNIPALPGYTCYGQSRYQHKQFKTAAALVYKNAGYKTEFIYGGDLTWRNVGNFFAREGFDEITGKAKINRVLHLKREDNHDWGVYDEFLYKYILQDLNKSKKPKFIYAMSTNNHPPFVLYKKYKSKELIIPKELKKHFKGDSKLILKRLYDYQYSLDMVGRFLDKFKKSPFAKNTIIAITADNNTIEGVIGYDDFLNESKKIPLFLYIPKNLLNRKIDTKTPGSHKDIFPTLYDLTLSNQPYYSIGKSLLRKERLHCGFNSDKIIIAKDGAFKFNHPTTQEQKRCNLYYKAAIAITGEILKRLK